MKYSYEIIAIACVEHSVVNTEVSCFTFSDYATTKLFSYAAYCMVFRVSFRILVKGGQNET